MREVIKSIYLIFVIVRGLTKTPPQVLVALIGVFGAIGAVKYTIDVAKWARARWVAYRTGAVIPDEVIEQDQCDSGPRVIFNHPVTE